MLSGKFKTKTKEPKNMSVFNKVYPLPYVGIVGNGTDKFTKYGIVRAVVLITVILNARRCVLVSGHSKLGGIDIWSEKAFTRLYPDIKPRICKPDVEEWNPVGQYGYMKRNKDIARFSDELHIIVANHYPDKYTGKRFSICYHDYKSDHVKSGACWTGNQFRAMKGIEPIYHVINNDK